MTDLLLSLLLAIELHASGACPAADDVARRLEPLLGTGATVAASDVATIRRAADGSLQVALADAAGQPIGERRFPRAATCADQAQTVAVTLAIWEAQIHPEIALRLDRLAPAAAAATTTETVRASVQAPLPPPAPRTRVSLGLALGGDWQPDSWAPAGRIELGLGPPDGRWRARAALGGIAPHTQDVAPGQARWWRASLSLGADVDAARGQRWALVLGAGAVTGLASISGTGFPVDRVSRSLDAGAELRARVEWRPGRVRPWLGPIAVAWLRRQTLDLQGTGNGPGTALPRVEPMLALGADFLW